MSKGSKLLLPFIIFLSLSYSSSSSDTLKPSESLAENQTLISSGRIFELGFFSPAGSNNLYLGIWYFNQTDKTVIWIANRDSPARNSSVSLALKSSGQLVLSEEGSSSDVWSSNQTHATNPILQLLDSGNLIVRETDDSNSEDYLWRSFDYPTDTLLAGQKLGWDKKTGLDRYLTSWKSSSDPSSGEYTFRLARTGDPEILVLKDGTQKIYRTGPWVGQRFSGVPPMNTSPTLNFSFLDNPEEVSYEVDESNPNIKSRLVMEPTGSLHRYAWVEDSMTWSLYWFGPKDQCDQYLACGGFGVCDASEFFVCNCTHGFEPRNPSAWAQRDASNGCVRKTKLDCGTDGFAVLRGMKLPDSGEVTVDTEKGLEECAETCKKDCDCTAYSNSRMVNGVGSGCLIWKGDLKDMRTYSYSGQNLYVRLAASDVPPDTISDSGKNKNVGLDVGVSVGVVMLVLVVAVFFAWRKKKRREQWRSSSRVSRVRTTQRNQDFLLNGSVIMSKRDLPVDNDPDDLELPLYDFDAVVVATNDFSDENKLGEGGFGYVYKGVLKEGEESAIKRLSKESGQGTEEFKNEVKLIAKLQHRNLVRLLGCCVDREEKILIYEYLSNRSLDTVLFHKERCFLLDWQRRFNIICGIARGLQYLHHDSRVRIIHRDLKASNILMDHDMNPKISDFGMARIFGGDETGSKNTRRVVGTYGYMAPEYAMDGVFSIKSDVFGFGVLVLEIITGKKNTGFYNAQNELNLLGYAWRMWKEGKGTGLLDPSIGETYSVTEVERCIQIGLLCVQERAEERPTMLSVVVLLNSETAALPQPKLPGFCLGRRQVVETDSSSSQQDETFSVNQVTVTMIDGR